MVQELQKEKEQREQQLKAMEDLKRKEEELKREFELKQVCLQVIDSWTLFQCSSVEANKLSLKITICIFMMNMFIWYC